MPTAGMEESIKVAVRARPVNQREKKLECDICVSMSGKTVTMLSERNPKHFTYDYTYWSVAQGEGTQNEIFEDIGNDMLSNAIDGFNCTLFAYGQTGSGKSFTMMGGQEEDDAGVIPRMIDGLFDEKDRLEKEPLQELQVRISYLEIYKEQVTDLFAALNSRHTKGESLKIMEHPKLGVYVKGLYHMPCETKQDVMGNLEYGLKMRTIASTNMNQNSSRSHAVFTIIVNRLEGERPKGKDKDERKSLHAKINLIDLAGSERTSKAQTEHERLKEGCAINQSLSQLGLVIKMLTEQATSGGLKAPMFRASKLTFLLKDSLAGNSKTCMMATISPASDNYDESISTLRFASSVKSIKTVAVQNKNKKDALIENLQEELRLFKAQMAAGGLNVTEAAEQLKERERLIKEQLHQDFQSELQAAKEMTRAREKALEESGLSHGHITEAFGITSGQPYMVNMAFDPMMAGCLIYLIQESKPTTMGSHKDNTIVLKGLGIPDHLCRLDMLDQADPLVQARQRAPSEGGGPVCLTRLSDGARVAVNGKLLEPGQTRQLQNGDQIFLGRIYVMKLVCPGEGAAPMQDDLVLQKEEMDTSELDNSASWKSLQDYVGQVVRQMSSKLASQLMDEIKQACCLTDQANEITAACRSDPLIFEVDLTSTYPPCVAIRVLECEKGRDCKDEEEWKNRYIWSVRQLNERLERMRDYWRECQNSGKPVELPALEDPWHEAEPTEIYERMRHLESMVEEAERAFKLSHGSQPLITRSMATESALLRLTFGLWRSCTISSKRERKSHGGRAALVKAGSGRMRTTIVADKPFGVSKKLSKPVEKTPTTSGRRMTLKLAGPEKSPEKQAETPRQSRASIFEKSPASSPSRLEPEATPELRRKDKEVEAAMAELQKQLEESNQQKAALEQQKAAMEHDLEVAWELVSELRGCLVDKMQQEDLQAVASNLKKEEPDKSSQPRQSSSQSLLIHADALAYATRAAVDAAKAVRKAKFQSGIAALPFSSPQLAVKREQKVEVIGYTAEPVSRSVSPATRSSPSLYRMPPTPSLPGMVATSMQTPSSRSWREAAAQPMQQFSQSCNAAGQTQLRPMTPPAVSMRATTPIASPRGREAHFEARMAGTPSPSPRRAPSVPLQCNAQPATRFQGPWAGQAAPQAAPTVPLAAHASWAYSQPGSHWQSARMAPQRRPSSGSLSQKTADNKAGSEGTWDSASQLGGAQCLQVAPDMFLVRVPSSGASPTLTQDLLSATLPSPVQS